MVSNTIAERLVGSNPTGGTELAATAAATAAATRGGTSAGLAPVRRNTPTAPPQRGQAGKRSARPRRGRAGDAAARSLLGCRHVATRAAAEPRAHPHPGHRRAQDV